MWSEAYRPLLGGCGPGIQDVGDIECFVGSGLGRLAKEFSFEVSPIHNLLRNFILVNSLFPLDVEGGHSPRCRHSEAIDYIP